MSTEEVSMPITSEEAHARYISEFMERPGGLMSGPTGSWRRMTPEERPFTPSSKLLRQEDPRAWQQAAIDLFRGTDGQVSLAYMPANETEWELHEAFAAYRLEKSRKAATR